VDWSWDYHIMMNEFRSHPKVCGWLYTEHHDVINEWNGYYRFDRTEKDLGLAAVMPGMTLRDFHAPFYIATGRTLRRHAAGRDGDGPAVASFLADAAPSGTLVIRWALTGWDGVGRRESWGRGQVPVEFQPWMSRRIDPIEVHMPPKRGLAILHLQLEDPAGFALHRNFTTFLVSDGPAPRDETVESPAGGRKERVIRIAPASFAKAEWSQGHWDVLDGLKVNGAGSGFFEYRLPWPAGLDPRLWSRPASDANWAPSSSSPRTASTPPRWRETSCAEGHPRSQHQPNSYPMTDTVKFPSAVRIRFAGTALGVHDLEDDPADHRGILSWHSQKRDKKLREAGSYGYLVADAIPPEALRAAAAAKEIVLRLEVDPALPGGLAIYGERFGRYPLDPTLVFVVR